MSMLQGSPWLLAHKSMLETNKPRKISLYGKDYVMWKDARGNINAIENACPHMGAMLSAGWCAAKSDGTSAVVCPFHALEFDPQGRTILPGSNKQTLPQLATLELIIQGDFIWSYGGYEPKIPIPNILDEIAAGYDFIGSTGDCSVETDLLSMLLNMHDYNHQNGTHRELFKITEVRFDRALKMAKVVVEQDADILTKIYPNTPQKIRLNNEVGMDWVRRNFQSFPEIKTPIKN